MTNEEYYQAYKESGLPEDLIMRDNPPDDMTQEAWNQVRVNAMLSMLDFDRFADDLTRKTGIESDYVMEVGIVNQILNHAEHKNGEFKFVLLYDEVDSDMIEYISRWVRYKFKIEIDSAKHADDKCLADFLFKEIYKIGCAMFGDYYAKKRSLLNDMNIVESVEISDNMQGDKMSDEEFDKFLGEHGITKKEFESW